ncbi:DUF4003 family protein [Bacillus alveayuensis]|jgi:hypothetical protein|uniref:DUF4003 family protein n=1 Tax=Aeribacillus alveayuensis TaxID=279215 RepID=UPI000AA35534
MFSALKSYHHFPIAMMLDLRFEKPEEKFQQFLDLYKKFILPFNAYVMVTVYVKQHGE